MSSVDSLTDSYFGCKEAPVWLPTLFTSNMLNECSSCTLRINAPAAATGTVYSDPMGLTIDESPLIILSVNGIQHSLIETRLCIPGAHRLEGRQTVCDAEIIATFRDTNKPDKFVNLCLPVDTGNENKYFSTLNKGALKNRPAFTTLLTQSSYFFMYTGPDIRGRSAKDSRPRIACDPVKQRIDYYVCETPIKIAADDLKLLTDKAGKDRNGPPKPLSEVTPGRIRSLGLRIKRITVEGPATASGTTRDGGVSTSAMKCYKLNADKDIIGDKIYVNHKENTSSLADELTNAAVNFDEEIPSVASIQPGDIQQILGIVIGVILGVLTISLIVYIAYRVGFKGYPAVVDVASATKP